MINFLKDIATFKESNSRFKQWYIENYESFTPFTVFIKGEFINQLGYWLLFCRKENLNILVFANVYSIYFINTDKIYVGLPVYLDDEETAFLLYMQKNESTPLETYKKAIIESLKHINFTYETPPF